MTIVFICSKITISEMYLFHMVANLIPLKTQKPYNNHALPTIFLTATVVYKTVIWSFDNLYLLHIFLSSPIKWEILSSCKYLKGDSTFLLQCHLSSPYITFIELYRSVSSKISQRWDLCIKLIITPSAFCYYAFPKLQNFSVCTLKY